MVLGRGKLSPLAGTVRISNRDPQGIRFAGVAVRNLPHKLSNDELGSVVGHPSRAV